MKTIRYIVSTVLLMAAPSVFATLNTGFDGVHRLRYEYLANGPRPNAQEIDNILVSRLYLKAHISSGPWLGQLEIQDSRAWLHDDSTPIGTDDVNTLEPIQAWLGYQGGENFPLRVRVGRITKNLSTRRLMARNRYRNTTNGFAGVDLNWTGEDWSVYSFLFRPVLRRPSDRDAIANNEFELDKTSSGQRFWGMELQPTAGNTQVQSSKHSWSAHVLALHESDRPNYPSRNRQLITVGAQYQWFDEHSGWHHGGELGLQGGTSRLTELKSDTQDLQHRAWFMHAEFGHRWDNPRQDRLSLVADYASGDGNLADNRNQRFDNLFGARRFDFGPTGIYGPQGRANMISPGLRWDTRPFAPTRLMMVWRGFWLAQAFDTHEGTGYLDTIAGDRYVGQQLEARIRQRINADFDLETGAAYFVKGDLLRGPALANGEKNAAYFYLQTTFRF